MCLEYAIQKFSGRRRSTTKVSTGPACVRDRGVGNDDDDEDPRRLLDRICRDDCRGPRSSPATPIHP